MVVSPPPSFVRIIVLPTVTAAWFVSLFQAQLWGLVITLPIVRRFILFKIGTRTKAIQFQFLAVWVKNHLPTLSRKCKV